MFAAALPHAPQSVHRVISMSTSCRLSALVTFTRARTSFRQVYQKRKSNETSGLGNENSVGCGAPKLAALHVAQVRSTRTDLLRTPEIRTSRRYSNPVSASLGNSLPVWVSDSISPKPCNIERKASEAVGTVSSGIPRDRRTTLRTNANRSHVGA